MVGVELRRQRSAEAGGERLLQSGPTAVAGVDRGDVGAAERGDPARVVQDLRDDVTRRLVTLELQDVDESGLVPCEQVDEVAVRCRDLSADDA